MMRRTLMTCVALAFGLVGPAFADTLTPSLFKTYFVGKSLGYMQDGQLHRITYNADGAVKVVAGGRVVYAGRWWGEGKKICTKYQGWPQRCGLYRQNSTTAFTTPRTGTVISVLK